MNANFEATMTEADFKRPLLDATEDKLVREIRGETDLRIDGLKQTLLGRILGLFSGGGRSVG